MSEFCHQQKYNPDRSDRTLTGIRHYPTSEDILEQGWATLPSSFTEHF